MRPADLYFLNKEEPQKSYLQTLRELILAYDPYLTEAWKYGMPFYCYNGKMCCYLWTHKKTGQPYIGIVEGKHLDHPLLIQEKRARMKIMLFDPYADMPVDTIRELLERMLLFYR